MIDWSQYSSEDPFRKVNKDKLFESRGIPNIIKEYTNIIFDDIKKGDFFYNFYDIKYVSLDHLNGY